MKRRHFKRSLFVNTTVKRDLTWGTPSPIPVLDPNLGFPVSEDLLASGAESIMRSFTTQIVGSQSLIFPNEVYRYFVGELFKS